MNWPMQSNGAEMLRLACSLATEAGLKICAPIHDALLLEAPTSRIRQDVEQLTLVMRDASEIILGPGKVCGVDVSIVQWPDRYKDERGVEMWDLVMKLLERLEHERSRIQRMPFD